MTSIAAVAALPDANPDNAYDQVRVLKGAIGELMAKLEEVQGKVDYYRKKDEDKRKNVVDSHAFKAMSVYSGKENELKDFETRLQALLRTYVGFERFLDIIKTYDDISEGTVMDSIQDKMTDEFEDSNEKPNVVWMNDQLYQVLCLLCQNSALQACRHLRGKVHLQRCRGLAPYCARSGWQI